MAENDAGGASIIPKYITRIDYDSTTDITKSWIRTYDGNNTKKAEVEMPIASTTSNGLVNRDAQTFAGKKTFNDQVIFAYASDAAQGTASTGSIIIGDPVKQHIAIDDNEIMAKTSDGKTVSTLYLNNEGGTVQVGGNLNPNAHNSLTLGLTGTRWANMFGVLGTFLNLDVEDTLYVNKNNAGTAGGISLRGAEGPMTSGIALRTTATPGTHGYVTGSWATYLTSKSGIGWIFRDADNSKNIASLSTAGRLVLNDVAQTPGIGSSDTYIAYPSGGKYACSTNQITGYLKITLPQSWTNTMMRFKVSVFNYKTGTSVEYLIGGYNYSPSTDWHQTFAQCLGKWEYPELSNLKVRFGHDGTKCAIYIGEANTIWTYPQVTVSDVTVGYSNYEYDKWASGWNIGFASSLGTITNTVENTNIAYRAYHADRATEDEGGANIKANYLTVLRQYESTGTTFKFIGVNKNGADMFGLNNSGLISIPEATASVAGLVTTNAQTWAGEKTFNAGIRFPNATTGLTSGINWTMGDNDQARIVAGATASNGGYLEIATSDDGNEPIYVRQYGPGVFGTLKRTLTLLDANGNTIFPGNLLISGNIMPSADNTYVIGDVNTKWKDVYSDVSHVYKTIYVNSSGVTSEGGIGLYSVNPPESYGIAIRNNLGTHGYVTTALSTFFSMSNANTAGWVFRFNGTNVASINGQGYAQFNKINMNRNAGTNNGRIGWYRTDFYTWYTYMSDRSTAGSAPTGGLPSLLGSVTTWAMRSLIENQNNYGWIWESCANTANATPVARMALSSTDGKLYLKNDINIITGDSDKFIHYVYKTKGNDGFTVDSTVNTIGASWRAGVTHSTSDNEYVIQSGSTAETGNTWLNGMKITQGTLNTTFGTSNLGGIGVANTDSTTGHGISLYNGGMSGRPTYGLFFGGTSTFGKHGYVQGDWATYFTMHQTANRGWIFMKVGDANVPVASINVDGKANFGETHIRGPLKIGDNANGDTNYIAFYGTTGDNPGSFNHAYIGENLYSSTECSELVIYKGNDIAPTASPSSPGPDRIRHIAAAHLFQIYKSALSGDWTTICDSTVPVNVFEINQSGVVVTGNSTISGNSSIGGTLTVTGATTLNNSLDVSQIAKFKHGSAATGANTGAVQISGGLSATSNSWFGGTLTVVGNITAPRLIGRADVSDVSDRLDSFDTRAATRTPTDTPRGITLNFKQNSTYGLNDGGSYIGVMSWRSYSSGSDLSGGYPIEIAYTANGNLWTRMGTSGSAWSGWSEILSTSNFAANLDGRYVNVSGDTMAGHLYATAGLSWNHAYWSPSGNIYCQPTANSQEWSIDVGSSSYTGSMWHVWSARNSKTMLSCYADDNSVRVENGRFHVNEWIQFNSGSGLYWPNHNGAHFYPNTTSSYGTYQMAGMRGGYHGFLLGNSTTYMHVMDSGEHKGFYQEDQGRWIFYYQRSTQRVGIGHSGPSYTLDVNGDTLTRGWFRTIGNTGWYSESYGGGWYMTDSTWIRSYGTKKVLVNAEIVSNSCNTGYAQFRAVQGNYGFMIRNDGSDSYFLLTASGDPYGTWNALRPFRINNSSGYVYCGTRLYGAVWNDYAEYRQAESFEAGRVVLEDSSGIMKLSTERLQPGASIVSDTYGFAIGETEKCKTPLAIAGRVLAYPCEPRDTYPLGAAVCSGPNGTVSLMTREEIREYPERIIGTVSEIPSYETWGTGNVKVNGRIWIKVK
jgi:hypothetical protein